MRHRLRWTGGSRTVAILLLAVVLPSAVTLVSLGLQLIAQDRVLLAQRALERRQADGRAAVLAYEQRLAVLERLLPGGDPPPGVVHVTITSAGVKASPRDGVAWLPHSMEGTVSDGRFAAAELLEYGGNDAAAMQAYRAMAASPDSAVRAGAMLRVARIERRRGALDAAIAAYRRMEQIDDVVVEGAPSDLIARRAVAGLLQESRRLDELRTVAEALEGDVLRGRWMLGRPLWDVTIADLEGWLRRPLRLPAERIAFSHVVAVLAARTKYDGRSRDVVVANGIPVTVLRRAVPDGGLMALLVPPRIIREWASDVSGQSSTGAVIRIPGVTHQEFGDESPAAVPSAFRFTAADSGLPWTIVVSPADDLVLRRDFSTRRRVLMGGLTALLLLLGVGSYVLWRVVRREAAVAQLQTDFVAAVSHEFRTPLTSLRHVAELLDENDDMPPERKKSFYEALGRNTQRLHHLVESLLDFARMESGRKPYSLKPLDAMDLVHTVADDFRRNAASTIAIDVVAGRPGDHHINGDAAALTNALWNLLDNAAKYSPGSDRIVIRVSRSEAAVAIAVTDGGVGIPAGEQRMIFERFVRGQRATALGIRGTGLGLAIVSHIARAHGGRVTVASGEGRGSTFTLMLPPLAGRGRRHHRSETVSAQAV